MKQRLARQERLAARCAARVEQVITDGDAITVPLVSADPNRTAAAWARYLGVSLAETKMIIPSSEKGRCWIKYRGRTSVTAHG